MSKVVRLRPASGHNSLDPIFFTKDQITVGTKFRYCGRTNPNGVFEVTHIKSYKKSGKGNWYATRETEVQKLNDKVTVVGPEKDVRTFSFSYLSYSAIWRLETGG